MASGEEGVSTYNASPRSQSPKDRNLYTAGHGLVQVVNNPVVHASGLLCWPVAYSDRNWQEIPPPLAPGILREVTRVDFADYFNRISDLHERFAHVRQQLQRDSARRVSVGGSQDHTSLRGEGLVQALRQVPPLYFQEDFSLTRPETFTEVVQGETEDEKNATLETLNGFLDIVETELLNEIAARSDSFFEAAESLQDLRMAISQTLEQITGLKDRMGIVNQGLCERAAKVQQLNRRRENLKEVMNMAQIVEAVVHAQDTLQLLIVGKDYNSALDLLDNLRFQCETKELSRLHCLRHLPSAMSDITTSIQDSLQEDFLDALNWKQGSEIVQCAAMHTLGQSGLRKVLEENYPWVLQKTGAVEATSSRRSFDDGQADEEFKKNILPVLQGLSRTGALSGVLSQCSALAVNEVKGALRSLMEILLPPLVCGSVSPDNSGIHDASLADQLKVLKPVWFVELLSACHSVTVACCDHFVRVCNLICQCAAEGKVTGHKGVLDRLLGEILQAVVDSGQNRWAKLLTARAPVVSQLPIDDLLRLVDVTQKCVDLAAVHDVRPLGKLGSVLQTQCKAWLEIAHTSKVMNLQEVLETENWAPSQPEAECQRVVDRILSHGLAGSSGGLKDVSNKSNGSGHPLSTALYIGPLKFCTVSTICNLLLILRDYITFHTALPDFATDSGRRIVELLTVFNTRSCQLVLGAQAMKVSGLRSITAKHLAMCSQCVVLLLELHGPVSSMLMKEQGQSRKAILQPELDRLKQDLLIHKEGIHSKLVSIMKERLLLSTRQLGEAATSTWSAKSKDGSSLPSTISEQMVKQIQILSKVLTPLLLEEQISDIFTRVAETFSAVLAPTFQNMTPDAEWGEDRVELWKGHWMANCKYLLESLEALPVKDESREGCLGELRRVYASGPPQVALKPAEDDAIANKENGTVTGE